MARIAYGFHPIMDGTIPYGGFDDDPARRGHRAYIGQPKRDKPQPPHPKRPKA